MKSVLYLEVLEDRTCPSSTLGSPQLTQIEVGNVPDFSSLGPILVGDYASIIGSTGWGVSTGTYDGTVRVPNSTTIPDPISNAQIQSLITQEIQSGAVAPPTSNSLYLIYLPSQPTDSWAAGTGGYHTSFVLNGQEVVYGVIWNEGPSFTLEDWYYISSHEAAESFVDPLGGNPEICDPVSWQFINVDNYHLANFIMPNGQPYQVISPPPNPVQPPQPSQSHSLYNELLILTKDWWNAEVDALYGNLPAFIRDVGLVENDILIITELL